MKKSILIIILLALILGGVAYFIIYKRDSYVPPPGIDSYGAVADPEPIPPINTGKEDK